MPTEHSVYMEIGRRIRDAREWAGMTQAELAKFLDMTGPELSRVEKGRRKVTIVELQILANVLQKSLLWFLTGEETPTANRLQPERRGIPPEAQREVEDFLAYIWEKYRDK